MIDRADFSDVTVSHSASHQSHYYELEVFPEMSMVNGWQLEISSKVFAYTGNPLLMGPGLDQT